MKSASVMMVLIITLFLLLASSLHVNADGLICDKKSVFTGASKAEVIDKCGQPLYISEDAVKTSGGGTLNMPRNKTDQNVGIYNYAQETMTVSTWTYVINGSYRELVFYGNNLDRIIDGALAK